jgi:hypothetical protein
VYNGLLSKIYVDGVLGGTSNPYLMAFNNALRVGYISSYGSNYKGLVDEVSIYDRALTEAEVQAIVNAGSLGKAKNQFNILTTSTPDMLVDTTISYQIQTYKGTSPITFAVISGNLPPGIALSSEGELSGAPTTEGEYSFTVRATDTTEPNVLIAERQIAAKVFTPLDPPSGLVSWWPGDTDAGDISGNNEGILQNGVLVYNPGKVSSAFLLDGVNDYVELPTMNIGNAFTLETWIFPTSTSSSQNLIANPSPTSSTFGILYYYGSSSPYVSFYQNGSTRVSSGAGTVPMNAWSHIALTHDGNCTRIYVNGLLSAYSSSYSMTFNNAINLGRRTSSNTHFKGWLDETTLYNRALTDAEILAIYNAGSVGKSKN